MNTKDLSCEHCGESISPADQQCPACNGKIYDPKTILKYIVLTGIIVPPAIYVWFQISHFPEVAVSPTTMLIIGILLFLFIEAALYRLFRTRKSQYRDVGGQS